MLTRRRAAWAWRACWWWACCCCGSRGSHAAHLGHKRTELSAGGCRKRGWSDAERGWHAAARSWHELAVRCWLCVFDSGAASARSLGLQAACQRSRISFQAALGACLSIGSKQTGCTSQSADSSMMEGRGGVEGWWAVRWGGEIAVCSTGLSRVLSPKARAAAAAGRVQAARSCAHVALHETM